MVAAAPDLRLAHLIDGPYQGWTERSATPVLRREIPSGIVPVIINFGPEARLIDPEKKDVLQRLDSFVAGLHETFVLVESAQSTDCVQFNLNPLGAYQILGVPMYSIANAEIPLDDLLGRPARRLISQIGACPDWAIRFALLDHFLLERAAHGRTGSPRIIWAWNQLKQSHGQIEVGKLAADLECSKKHLITQFRNEIGLPPKTLARIIRFGRVASLLKHGQSPRWVEIAHHCGYYDQAHLIREFREFAGTTPGDYAGHIRPDGGGVAGA